MVTIKRKAMNAKFFIVDDNDPFRRALKDYIENELNYKVIGEASNGAEAICDNNVLLADVILMDIVMKELDGITTARKLLWEYPYLKILAVTGNEESVFLRQLVNNGFFGCVFKNQLFNELSPAINQLLNGKRFFPKSLQL
jgi:DNA-binding NarL/FixJ family response regulator